VLSLVGVSCGFGGVDWTGITGEIITRTGEDGWGPGSGLGDGRIEWRREMVGTRGA